MCYEQLGEFWNKTKWIDPIASQSLEHQTDLMSDAGESLGERWNMPWLAEEARYNKDHTSEALGKGAVSAASWWAGNAAGGLMGAGGAAGANAATNTATTAAEIAARTAAEEAAKLAAEKAAEQAVMKGGEGLLSQGFGNTMEAGLMGPNASLADTYMPKNLMDAYNYGPGMSQAPGPGVVAPGQQFNANLDTGLMNRGMSDYAGKVGSKKFNQLATRQGLNMMQPQEPQQMAPPQRYQHQEQRQQPMYGQQETPEELKRKLRAMGYPI